MVLLSPKTGNVSITRSGLSLSLLSISPSIPLFRHSARFNTTHMSISSARFNTTSMSSSSARFNTTARLNTTAQLNATQLNAAQLNSTSSTSAQLNISTAQLCCLRCICSDSHPCEQANKLCSRKQKIQKGWAGGDFLVLKVAGRDVAAAVAGLGAVVGSLLDDRRLRPPVRRVRATRALDIGSLPPAEQAQPRSFTQTKEASAPKWSPAGADPIDPMSLFLTADNPRLP